ncbi:MAG: hypothetical protein ACXVYY_01410 [Oryzihumus sp.]
MADERTFTETEHAALVADAVARETAAASQRITDLETELTSTRTRLDVAEAAVTTEKAARETAEQALSTFQTETAAREAATARRGERETKIREVAAHLGDDYFTAERVDRWAAMDDEAFTAYVAEVAALTTGAQAPAGGQKPPRETAMTGQTPKQDEDTPVLRRWLGLTHDAKEA